MRYLTLLFIAFTLHAQAQEQLPIASVSLAQPMSVDELGKAAAEWHQNGVTIQYINVSGPHGGGTRKIHSMDSYAPEASGFIADIKRLLGIDNPMISSALVSGNMDVLGMLQLDPRISSVTVVPKVRGHPGASPFTPLHRRQPRLRGMRTSEGEPDSQDGTPDRS